MKLVRGDNDNNVKLLQEKLGLDPIGNFGPKTEQAVKEFQRLNGLKADGIVGNTTWNLIMSKSTIVKKEPVVIPATQKAAPPPAPAANVGGLKLDKLKNHIPDYVISQIPDVAIRFQINNALRLSHFLSQCGHESGGFKLVTENLNYSSKALATTFKKYFPTQQAATPYERNPEKIANVVYANRMGNGSKESGEGYKFRGRGYIQLTGKDNYVAFGKSINEDLTINPDLVATKYPLLSAAWFFQRCLKKADMGASDEAVVAVTKSVNGGLNGFSDRLKHFKEYYSLLS
jgi:putative chitinase